ncbi:MULTISPECIES: class III extradiol ring-cleavage dioxygenase [unclassified Pseudoalteromonas]|uniref:DODA-type extradiol aromatic ring-opening family dioxygenase n=1 Tax=unclassified Pseudoalteromonas TaxID=194690 RepID=UPI001108FB42|nr:MULTISPECIES: class III extradiol ring-cleavage dioxygenase [unclassified Pseudoalteromonas]TMN84671.1 dioxygenase [Pseudoalteromonas sp. S410]TMN91112.1 dioxygenase [Pseudoalteromonas sp. S408]TMN97991.1 dioxygenase [Pseudoalteromonas sp. S407]TMO01211.1 dioxygenase [Pseudoalteromonas sp. S409]TMO09206.1 dioxygenase [Pseudoalteromonas sp. S186]
MTQPALFLSHGSPIMAIEQSATANFIASLGQSLNTPSAIVVFSAHFDQASNIKITAGAAPKTIHDFYNFPTQMYNIHYRAPGSPKLANTIANYFNSEGMNAILDTEQGWDHGVWIPLRLMYPHANIPIVQVSINTRLGAKTMYKYGQLLAPLREQNILIIGSGGISHNLAEIFKTPATPNRVPMVKAFTHWVEQTLLAHDIPKLLNYLTEAPFALFNHPTQEHFLPLFAAMGAGGSYIEKIHEQTEMDILALDAYKFY